MYIQYRIYIYHYNIYIYVYMYNIYNIVSLLYIVKWMDPVGEQLNKTCQWISGDSPPAA